jgi:poly(A) polymerase
MPNETSSPALSRQEREVPSVPRLDAPQQRRFAVEVVRRLRAAGFSAYWAGGCVRDQLMGVAPKDYDVATDATPPQIRRTFRDRRTLAIGAAFGTITVVGPRQAGQVEVTTFRQDAAYSDGRHPDSVTFSTAELDASRRDFTINGLFFDPIEDQVIDFVGGQEDLRQGLIRAIGEPQARFAEDKLRMLRAVRFSAAFQFPIEPLTQAAVRQMADQIAVVSPERIAAEMQRMLVDRHRAAAVRLLLATELARVVLPEILGAEETGTGSEPIGRFPAESRSGEATVPLSSTPARGLDRRLAVMEQLRAPGFPLALAALLCEIVDARGARDVCRRWRLSNEQTDRVGWLVAHQGALQETREMRWSVLQRLLVAEAAADLVALGEAAALAGFGDMADVEHCQKLLQKPREELDPPPLLSGEDLIARNVPSGPIYRVILERIRDAQLDGELAGRDEALTMVDRLLKKCSGS